MDILVPIIASKNSTKKLTFPLDRLAVCVQNPPFTNLGGFTHGSA